MKVHPRVREFWKAHPGVETLVAGLAAHEDGCFVGEPEPVALFILEFIHLLDQIAVAEGTEAVETEPVIEN